MARHRSPRGPFPFAQAPRSIAPSVLSAPVDAPSTAPRRRRGAHRRPVLGGVAVLGVLAATAVTVGQATGGAAPTPTQGDGDAELAAQTRPEPTVLAQPELVSYRVPEDPAAQVVALAKGTQIAEERSRPAPPPVPDVLEPVEDVVEELTGSCRTSGYDGVEPHVAAAGQHLQERFGIPDSDMIGVAQRPNNPTSDHPHGLALDFMIDPEDEEIGDALAAYAERNADALGITYVLWQVEAHYDHVHISFSEDGGSGLPCSG